MSTQLYYTLRTAAKMTPRVVVSYSGGKDSAVVLDLCVRFFKEVIPVYMFIVPGLSWQKRQFAWVKKRYGLDVLQIPHFSLSEIFRYGYYSNPDPSVPFVQVSECYDYIRLKTDCYWIAAGELMVDSLWRRGMIWGQPTQPKNRGTINLKRGRIFPLAHWKKKQVIAYIQQNHLMISPESYVLGFSFAAPSPRDLFLIRKHFPIDFEKIMTWFPEAELGAEHYRIFQHHHKGERVGDIKVPKG